MKTDLRNLDYCVKLTLIGCRERKQSPQIETEKKTNIRKIGFLHWTDLCGWLRTKPKTRRFETEIAQRLTPDWTQLVYTRIDNNILLSAKRRLDWFGPRWRFLAHQISPIIAQFNELNWIELNWMERWLDWFGPRWRFRAHQAFT